MPKESKVRRTPINTAFENLKIIERILKADGSSKKILKCVIRAFQKLGFERVQIRLNNPTRFFGDRRIQKLAEFSLTTGQQKLGSIIVDGGFSPQTPDLAKVKSAVQPFVNCIALALDHARTDAKMKAANQDFKKRAAATTTELAQKNKILKQLATHDELSGLPNRRYFDKRIAEEFQKASARRPITLAMIDIDFLKQVNDTRGHAAGDRLIVTIGKILQRDKKIDFAARYAGDEFVVLLIGKKSAAQREIMGGILRKIKTATKSTVSIGLTTHPDRAAKSTLELFRTADDALYHAKHTGRDKFVCALDCGCEITPLSERRRELQAVEQRGITAVDYIGQLELINQISEGLQKINDTKGILQTILKVFQQNLHCQRVRIYRVNKPQQRLDCIKAVGVRDSSLRQLQLSLDPKKSVSAEAVATKKVVNVGNTLTRKNFDPRIIRLLKVKAVLAIPLTIRQHVIGVLIVDYDPQKVSFTDLQHRFFLALGNHIALALEQVRLFEKINSLNLNLIARVKSATTQLRQYSSSLEQKVADNKVLRKREIRTHFELVSALITILESKDTYTRGHSTRVANIACQLGTELQLPEHQLLSLRYASLLHDLGKLTVDQIILNKREALTEAEVEALLTHPIVGAKIVSSVQFLQASGRIIRQHHERWDGIGYPDRLRGKKILLEARIIALVDAYDAMTTRRSYGHQMSKTEAIKEIKTESGKQFDPTLVKVFVKMVRHNKLR